MKNNTLLCAALFCIAASAVLILSAEWTFAQSNCEVTTLKSAPGAGDLEFEFTGVEQSGFTFQFTLADGESSGGSVDVGTTTVITEDPQVGWRFGGIECLAGDGVIITELEDGFSIECVNAGNNDADCLITNVRTTENIPTLSEWGMIAAAAGLGLVAVFYAVRRKRNTA